QWSIPVGGFCPLFVCVFCPGRRPPPPASSSHYQMAISFIIFAGPTIRDDSCTIVWPFPSDLPQCLCWVGVAGARPGTLWVWARGRPHNPHLGRFGGARVPSGCPLRTSRAKSVWLTTSS